MLELCHNRRYFFLKQDIESKYILNNPEVVVENYTGLLSNSYEMNMSYFKSTGSLVVALTLAFSALMI